jgi:outer membrane protein OmpA-like peptidoglycan-associated protein/outer membrane protein W
MAAGLLRIKQHKQFKKCIQEDDMSDSSKGSALRFRWRIVAGACIVACALMWSSAEAQTADTAVKLDIPAQSMGTALNSLAVQANLQIFFEQSPVAGLEAPAVSGTMTAKQALQILLANTPLRFSENDDGTLVISQKPKLAHRKPPRQPQAVAPATPEPAETPATVAAAPVQSVLEREGPWLFRARALYLAPRNASESFDLPGAPPSVVPSDGTRSNDRWAAELDAEYFFASHWSSELAVTLPQAHDLLLRGTAFGGSSGNVGRFNLMPEFLTLKYGFLPESAIRPYVGVGLNVTSIYGVETAPFNLSRTTVGPAAQAGFDIRLSDHWELNADAKWARSRPEVEFEGERVGRMKLDPLLFGVGIGYRFGGKPAPAPLPVTAAAPVAIPPPLDSDGDGVPDSIDRCPNTPRGVKVDASGCPLDSDNDGVPDYLDQCPGTPPGLKVDANGCEIEEMVLTGVTFETASAQLTRESFAILDNVVEVLRQRSKGISEVHGYTDSRGKDDYNQKLSARRAAAVMQYLIDKGIPAERLRSKGFGKANPVASNDTAEGRAKNRRVTVQFSKPVLRQ